MRHLAWLAFAATALTIAEPAIAAPKPRSPRHTCRYECRKQYRSCVRKLYQASQCFDGRSKCYGWCRRNNPPTTPGNVRAPSSRPQSPTPAPQPRGRSRRTR